LEKEWTVLVGLVGKHNGKCGAVPENSPRAGECNTAMGRLQGKITGHIKAVKDFNRAVRQASRQVPAQGGKAPKHTLASPILSEAQEMEIGKKMAGDLNARMTFISDPHVVAYVQGLVNILARHSTRSGIAYNVKICTDCVVPACSFACSLPGGTIYINSALIRSFGNESELAGVLAHEIAHTAARHQSRNLDHHVRAAGIGVLLAGPVWPVVQSAAFMKFKRDDEAQADRLAVEMLYRAGIRPTGLITFFEKIRRMRPKQGMLASAHDFYFSSHPSDQDRIRKLEPMLADSRFNKIKTADSAKFHAIQKRLPAP
jgi:predicted Zn-dependent protease